MFVFSFSENVQGHITILLYAIYMYIKTGNVISHIIHICCLSFYLLE